MRSWRDTVSQPVQDIFDGLYGLAADTATDLLTKNKEFFPFCVQAVQDGARLVGADPDLGEQPPSQAVLDALYDGCRSRRDSFEAVAFVSDVRLSDGDAVRVDLEHRDGHALQILLPYRLRKLRRGIDVGEMSVSAGTRRIW